MKHSTLSLCRLISANSLIAMIVSACCPGSGCPPSPPARIPPGHNVQWLSRKANPNAADADQYYRGVGAITALAGGGERRETLDDFKVRNGFTVNDATEIEATYYN